MNIHMKKGYTLCKAQTSKKRRREEKRDKSSSHIYNQQIRLRLSWLLFVINREFMALITLTPEISPKLDITDKWPRMCHVIHTKLLLDHEQPSASATSTPCKTSRWTSRLLCPRDNPRRHPSWWTASRLFSLV